MSLPWPIERVAFARQAIDECLDAPTVTNALSLLAGPPLTVKAVRQKLAAMRAAIRQAGGIVPDASTRSQPDARLLWSPARRKLAAELIAANAPNAEMTGKINELPGLYLSAQSVSKRIFEFRREMEAAEKAAVARAKLKREFEMENARLQALEYERAQRQARVVRVVRKAPAAPDQELPLLARRPRGWDCGYRMGCGQ